MEIRKERKVSHSSELCLLMMQLTRCLAVFIGSQEMMSQYQRQYFSPRYDVRVTERRYHVRGAETAE